VERALEQHEIAHDLHVAKEGNEALNYVAEMGIDDGRPCPDVLLLDQNLPKVAGPEVLEQFRAAGLCSDPSHRCDLV
jgi:CheY-like chemotaxis protein